MIWPDSSCVGSSVTTLTQLLLRLQSKYSECKIDNTFCDRILIMIGFANYLTNHLVLVESTYKQVFNDSILFQTFRITKRSANCLF